MEILKKKGTIKVGRCAGLRSDRRDPLFFSLITDLSALSYLVSILWNTATPTIFSLAGGIRKHVK